MAGKNSHQDSKSNPDPSSPFAGKKAPAFALPDQNGAMHALKEYLGKKVVLYFYPKDMTSGCTLEAQIFRDKEKEFQKLNTVILGVSVDSVDSHKKFCEKESLNFTLLSDVKKETVEKYGVWREKSMYGKKYMGILRETFLIDEAGKIIKHYQKVQPATHADEVLGGIQKKK